jgi:quercetin dioxygenase-like cupin family protein
MKLNPTQYKLPDPTIHITTNDENTRKARIHSSTRNDWSYYHSNAVGFNVVYTTSQFPVSLNNSADLDAHNRLLSQGKLGLVNPNGTVCRIVDMSPGHEPLMHRTQSLDYGIVLEGEVYMDLDGGESEMRLLKRGDIAVQRGTMHAWRNASDTQWARMLFVLQDCEPLVVGGERLKEDLGRAVGDLPRSGNDA